MSVLLKNPGEFFKVVDEATMFKASRFVIGSAEDGRGMDSGHYVRRKSGLNKLSALFSNAKFCAEQGLGRGGAQGHNHLGLDQRDLRLEPGTTSRNFLGVWFLVNAAFATRLPLKMFDNIRDVSLGTIDAGLLERSIKKSAGGTNERFAREIFFVARLFADKHHYRAAAAFAEDSLGAELPKVTSFATGGRGAQRRQSYFGWEEVFS